MDAIKLLLVILLSIPIAFFIWKFTKNLYKTLQKQMEASEEIRIRKANSQARDRYYREERVHRSTVEGRYSRQGGYNRYPEKNRVIGYDSYKNRSGHNSYERRRKSGDKR